MPEPLTPEESAKLKKLSGKPAAELNEKQAKKLKKLKKREAALAADAATPSAKKLKATAAAAPSAKDAGAAAHPGTQSSQEGPRYSTFEEAPFAPKLKEALMSAGFASPTPIQSRAWPAALSGSDLVAVAKTGSGKTLAFALPLLHRLATTAGGARSAGAASPRALVMSPTRELTIQIAEACVKFATPVGVSCACVYGGAPVHAQKAMLKASPPALVVATPGRLVDLMGQQALLLGGCVTAVLDEADRMLDMGFEPQLKQVFAALPAARQTLLFTATWPKSVRKLASEYVRSEQVRRWLRHAAPALAHCSISTGTPESGWGGGSGDCVRLR